VIVTKDEIGIGTEISRNESVKRTGNEENVNPNEKETGNGKGYVVLIVEQKNWSFIEPLNVTTLELVVPFVNVKGRNRRLYY
jgi:hypothetical protein